MSDAILDHDPARGLADALTIDTLLACALRELARGALQDRPPRHDHALRARWREAGATCWLRLPLDGTGLDLHAPLAYRSATGRHRFGAPIFVRRRGRDELTAVDLLDLFDLLAAEYRTRAPLTDETAARLRARLAESRDNLAAMLEARAARPPGFDCFLDAEQALIAGHPFHPLAKSRWGWDPAEVGRYSPELGETFALAYFLADPALTIEDRADDGPGLELLRDELEGDPSTPPPIRRALARHPDWRLLPVHPWEERVLLADDAVRAAIDRGALIALGACGRPFAATSSVRTVYRRDLPFMLKLSLHVAITNGQRVNQLHELRKGVAVARFLASPPGQRLAAAMPWLRILRDPASVAVRIDGRVIDGFSTTLRDNPFRGDQRVAVVAALCEPALFGKAPLRRLAEEVAAAGDLSIEAAALAWFDRYLSLVVPAVVAAHDRHGLSLEAHQQNLGVALDHAGLPIGLFFRDNQGFFVRQGRAAEALAHAPGLADAGPCVLPEALVDDPIRYYFLVNNLLGVVQALGADGLADEDALCAVLARHLRAAAADDESGLVRDLVEARAWPAKGNLRMVLEDQDEMERPVESPAPYVAVDNPILALAHRSPRAVAPDGGWVYGRRFDDYGATLRLRGLDLDRDLALIHDWSNRDYAREFWQQQGPIRELEAYYLELLASPDHHAFLGHLDDQPAFLIETYWAPREVVGRAYHVLPGDHGLHVLAAPPRHRLPGFTRRVVQVSCEMLFADPRVGRIVAEPDHRNARAERLFLAAGFERAGTVELPDKRAHLFVCTRRSLVSGAWPPDRPRRPTSAETRGDA